VLLVTIIVWAVALVGATAFTVLRGWRLYRKARAIQREVERRIPSERVDEINRRLARLQEQQAELELAVARMQRSLARLGFVMGNAQRLAQPLLLLRYAVRRR
jgi:hypothetical protein